MVRAPIAVVVPCKGSYLACLPIVKKYFKKMLHIHINKHNSKLFCGFGAT